MKQLTLGSLFDGSGGFPLGAMLNNITPIWASEIEPFPIRVTTKRIPHMKHYGDITKMDGSKIEPVDIITFGSPCTDLSIAGKKEGLGGKQSSLFHEAIRIIKEMRYATHGEYPRFIIWENVPGAFSSNKGNDFRTILSEIIQIIEPNAEVPPPDKKGWSYADILLGDGWSIAYRTIDAQFFGVAQRRKRIYLVADFRSEHAGKILFECKGMPRNFTPSGGSWEGVAKHSKSSVRIPSNNIDNQTLILFDNRLRDGIIKQNTSGKVQTLVAIMGTGGGNGPLIYSMTTGCFTQACEEKAPCLMARDHKYPPVVNCPPCGVRKLTPTEFAKLQGFPAWWCSELETLEPTDEEIRWWGNVFETYRKIMGKSSKTKTRNQIIKWLKNPRFDSAEYKMWGNGVALPCVCFVMRGIVEFVESELLEYGKPNENPVAKLYA